MRKSSVLKFGFAVLIAASTMLGSKPARAGALCVFSYTLPNGHTCTYNGLVGNCCQYTGDPHCHPICN